MLLHPVLFLIALAIWSPVSFLTICPSSVKKCHGYCDRDFIELVDFGVGSRDILKIIILEFPS